MSGEDKLLYFLEGLKPWARTELLRQRVKNLSAAQAAAEQLTDYSLEGPSSKIPLSTPTSSDNGNKRPKSWSQDKSGGVERRVERSSSNPKRPLTQSGSQNGKKPLTCWICDGPHRAMECPKKSRMTALLAQEEEEEERRRAAHREPKDEESGRMVALRMLNALNKQSEAKKVSGKGLMFIDALINGVAAKSVMVDTGATHNFISTAEAKRLGLKLERDAGRMKAVNSRALPTSGLARRVKVKIGPWEGQTDLVAVHMDDFDVVLGMDFLLEKGAIPVPAIGSLLIMGDQPTMVTVRVKSPTEAKLLSAL